MPPIIGTNIYHISHVSPMGKPSAKIIGLVKDSISASGGDAVLIVHPDYYRLHLEWYGCSPFGGLHKFSDRPITLDDHSAFMARIKDLMNLTTMPAFVLLDGTKGWRDDRLPSFLSWYQPKAPAVLVPTLEGNPTPVMLDSKFNGLEWTALLVLLKDLGVKKLTVAGELSYVMRNRWFRKPITGCLDITRDNAAHLFPVSADPKFSFPNAVLNIPFVDMLMLKLGMLRRNLRK